MIPRASRPPVLVAHSYFLQYDPKQVEKMKPYAPLATLIAAACLRNAGHEVHLFDAMLASGVEAFDAAVHDIQPGIVLLLEDNFNFLTKMCTTRMRQAALEMIRSSKGTGAHVAVNGSDAIDDPGVYLDAGAEAVIVGEAEPTVTELVAAWQEDSPSRVTEIAGLALRAEDRHTPGTATRVRRTPSRPHLDDLDALPFPAWDLVDVERYRQAWKGIHGRLSWNMATSRGCPYRCNWCAKPLFGTRYAQRTPANVAEELSLLRAHVDPDHVWFADDIFGLTPQWIESFAAEVAARDARTPFMMQSRVNLMKPRVVDALARAGAEEVWLGVESGSQAVLDAMDKGTKIAEIRAATRTLRAHGIRRGWFIQLGYLGETWEDILRTRDLIRAERPDEIGVSVSYPLPGTKFYEMVRDRLGAKRNWEDSGDLAMMFHGTYTTSFYRRIRDLLHAEVDLERGRSLHELDQQWDTLARAESGVRSAAPT